jgi:hypothetical protein
MSTIEALVSAGKYNFQAFSGVSIAQSSCASAMRQYCAPEAQGVVTMWWMDNSPANANHSDWQTVADFFCCQVPVRAAAVATSVHCHPGPRAQSLWLPPFACALTPQGPGGPLRILGLRLGERRPEMERRLRAVGRPFLCETHCVAMWLLCVLHQLQAGEPTGLCVEAPTGVFSRAWSLGTAELDCNSWTAKLPFATLNGVPLV